MGYSNNDRKVRVDRFKESGKWYDTLEVTMDGDWEHFDIIQVVWDAVNKSHKDQGGDGHLVKRWLEQGGYFVCLEPYHKHSHPVMLTPARLHREPYVRI